MDSMKSRQFMRLLLCNFFCICSSSFVILDTELDNLKTLYCILPLYNVVTTISLDSKFFHVFAVYGQQLQECIGN